MDQTTGGILRPALETFWSFFPTPFYLQAVQGLSGFMNAILGLFGIPPLFQAF